MKAYRFTKRVFDILIGLAGLIVMLPLCLIIKVSFLLLRDKGTVLYTQDRIGKDGKMFKIYKFRSMIQNADEMLEELLKDENYKKEWEENQKIENDPRITKIGKLLRKSSLDELPQLLNVLKGDMSIVGPRPLVERELEEHGGGDWYWQVKPGITGWWASHGRSDTDYQERLDLEYYYIKNQSFKLDLICILKTIKGVLTSEGAQ